MFSTSEDLNPHSFLVIFIIIVDLYVSHERHLCIFRDQNFQLIHVLVLVIQGNTYVVSRHIFELKLLDTSRT